MPEIIIKLGDQIVQKYYLYKDHISIGRAPENEIAIENLAVSRRHAEISRENGSYVLEDLNSANGTFVNGVQVTRTEIVDKDVISIGKHKLYFYNQQVGAGAVAGMQMVEKTMLVTRPTQTKAMLRVVRGKQKDQVFELNKVENRIGRAADNEIRLGDWFVSKHHAEIVRKGMVYVVRDLASWRHTLVNGQIVDEQVLKPGDEIQFGPKIAMVFEVADGTAAREGTGRKPVELQGGDQPLPFAGADPGTPLPIAGAGRVSRPAMEPFPGEPAPPPHVRPYQNGAANNPQLDEGWDEDFEPEDYVDGDSAAEDDSFADEFDDSQGIEEVPVAEIAPVRLQDESQEVSGGWEAAAAQADAPPEAPEESPDFGNYVPRADASDSWSPEAAAAAQVRAGEADLAFVDSDAVQPDVAGDEPQAAAVVESAGGEPEGGEAIVASFDSGGLESDALREEPAQEQPAVDTAEAGGADKVHAGPASVHAGGAALVDSIMESFGERQGVVRSEIEMWVGALTNPSRIIRKQAQRQLRKLTGQVYDIEP